MSEANETNDKLAKIKEQIMIATHETGEMPSIKNSKTVDPTIGYRYDEKENVLYVRNRQTWNLIKDDLNADLSSGGAVMNVSIKPLEEIGDMSDKDEDELQDKVNGLNQKSRYEYYRLITRHEEDYLLCYSFNDSSERDKFAAEMDYALEIGDDVDQDRGVDERKGICEDLDEEDNDREIVIVRREKKHDDKKTDGKKGPEVVDDKKNHKDQKSEKSDGNDKQDVQSIAAKEVNDGKGANNQEGTQNQQGNTEQGSASTTAWGPQTIDQELKLINGKKFSNRFEYLEKYFDAAMKYNEPEGYSWMGGLAKRQEFTVSDSQPPTFAGVNLGDRCHESMFMHILSDALYGFLNTSVKIQRKETSSNNKVFLGKSGDPFYLVDMLTRNFDNSPFGGYLRHLISDAYRILGDLKVDRIVFCEAVIHIIHEDYVTMLRYKLGHEPDPTEERYPWILPYGYLVSDWVKRDMVGGGRKLIIENVYGGSRTLDAPALNAQTFKNAYEAASECRDIFPSGDPVRDWYYYTLANSRNQDLAIAGGLIGDFEPDDVREVMVRLNEDNKLRGDFMSEYKDPVGNDLKIRKLLGTTEMAEVLDLSSVGESERVPWDRYPSVVSEINHGRPRTSLEPLGEPAYTR